jgi:glucose/arabinose dehydrogenase
MNDTNQSHPDEYPYHIEIIADNLTVPWAVAVSNMGRIYITERTGTIRILENGTLISEPLINLVSPFISRGEGGLLGIALDPNYSQNHNIYIMHTYLEGNTVYNRVVRLFEEGNKAVIDYILIDRIPGGTIHNGGRIKFGPDQKLYITTGDAGRPFLAQDLNSTAGKILRISSDGTIPEDNPLPGSPIYSFGHRNPQGLAWDQRGVLYASEHGQTAHDEINLILPGRNYGWPLIQGDEEIADSYLRKPLINSNDITWAPSGIAFVNQGPWQGRLLASTLRGEALLSFTLNSSGTRVERVDSLLSQEYGRLREVLQADDGSIYLTTSNRDGRGIYRQGDDKVLRLVPNV